MNIGLRCRRRRAVREQSRDHVDADSVAGTLPYYEHNKISEDDWRQRIALRQKLIGNRMVG